MGKLLEKKKKEMERRFNNFNLLSKCRNMDFPNNLTSICSINLKIFLNYWEKEINNQLMYNIKYDYTLLTFIYNYIASLKSYLNRKKRVIEQRVPVENRQEIINIFEKYWKRKRNQTAIDKLIVIRDRMEHNQLTSGITLKRNYLKTHIEDHLLVDNINIVTESKASLEQINKLNSEIEEYVNNELKKINLRECCLFLNAFNRRFNKTPFTDLIPEETEFEKNLFDNKIEALLKIKD